MLSLVLYFYSGPILYDFRCLQPVRLFTGSSTIMDNLLFKTENTCCAFEFKVPTSCRKKLFFYLMPMKRVWDTCVKNSSVVLQFYFFFWCGHKPKMIFGQITHAESDQMCKFHRFCPARCACNNVAHGILSRDKLQNVFSSFTDKI